MVNIFRNILYLSLNQGLNYLAPLLLMPYLLRVLDFEKYGFLIMIQAIMMYASVIVDYGFSYSGTRQVSINKANKFALNKIFLDVIQIKLILCLISLALLILIFAYWPSLDKNWTILSIAFISVIASVFNPNWYLQGIESGQLIALLNLSSKSLVLAFTYLLVKTKDDLNLALLLQSLGQLTPSIIGFFWIYRKYNYKFTEVINKDSIASHLKQGKHIFLISLLGNIYGQGAIIAVSYFAGNESAGSYGVLQKISSAVAGLAQPIAQAFYPRVCQTWLEHNNQWDRLVIKYITFSFFGSFILTSGMLLFSQTLIFLIVGQHDPRLATDLQIFSVITCAIINNVLITPLIAAKTALNKMQRAYLIAAAIFIFICIPFVNLYKLNGMMIGIALIEWHLLICALIVILPAHILKGIKK